jgi:hypothetical protein
MIRKHRTTPRSPVKADDDGLCASSDLPVVPICRGLRMLIFTPNQWLLSGHPIPQEGRIMIVTKRGVECGGRGSVLRATGLQGGLAKGL